MLFFLAYISPWASTAYDPYSYAFNINPDLPYSFMVFKLEQYFEATGIAVAGIIYLLVIGILIHMVKN